MECTSISRRCFGDRMPGYCSQTVFAIVSLIGLVAAALTVGMPGVGCSRSTELVLPPLPPGVAQPAEYAFGDAVMSRDQHAWGPIFDMLAQRFGKARLRVIHLTRAANADIAALRGSFDREMVDRRRWHGVAQKTAPHDAWAFGYESPDGHHVLMLVGLKPRPGEVLVPLNILTTLSGAK